MPKILVVVDMQNDFITGPLGTPEARAIVPKVVEKIRAFNGHVFATRDTHDVLYPDTQEGKLLPVPHCIVPTAGWKMHPDIQEAIAEKRCNTIIYKDTFGSRRLGEILARQNHIDEVVIVGLCTDICVISNAMLIKAFMPEAKITVDASCCAGSTPENHKLALQAMKNCQIFIENEEE